MVLKTTLAALPDIEALRKLTQSLAMLDAIMSPEWEYRYYSFNSKWYESEMMASMRNGSGDEYFPDEDDPDGSEYMLSILDGRPSTYREFAEAYHEKPLDVDAIEHIYRHAPLTNEIIARLNNGITLESLTADVEQIAYPQRIDSAK